MSIAGEESAQNSEWRTRRIVAGRRHKPTAHGSQFWMPLRIALAARGDDISRHRLSAIVKRNKMVTAALARLGIRRAEDHRLFAPVAQASLRSEGACAKPPQFVMLSARHVLRHQALP